MNYKSLFIFIFFCFSYLSFSKENLTINVSDAHYRPLNIAIPEFGEEKKNQPMRKMLYDLTNFTESFYIVKEQAYLKTPFPDSAQSFKAWRSLGIDIILRIRILPNLGSKIRFEAKVLDLLKGKSILHKEYTVKGLLEFREVCKRILSKIEFALTQKKGVFTKKIVFTGIKKKPKKGLYAPKQVFTCDANGDNLKQITSGNSIHLSPSWEPGEKSILFTSYTRGNPDLYRIDLDSFKITSLSKYDGINSGGVFNPSASHIVYTGSDKKGANLYVLDPKTKKRKAITFKRALQVDPDFSHDGKWLAYVSSEFGRPHIMKAQVQQVQAKGGESLRLGSPKKLTHVGWYNTMPRWSPTSNKIVYASFDKAEQKFDLFTMDENGKNHERLTLNSGNNEGPTWSPNGKLIMFHSDRDNPGKAKQLYLMKRDGTSQKKIPLNLYHAESPRWSL